MLLCAKNLHTIAAAGLIGAFYGGPVGGMVASISIEIGKIALEIAKKRHNIRKLEEGHELGYIIHAKNTLS